VPDRTKIVFSHGEEIAVQAQVQDVRRRLSKDRKTSQPFTKLKTTHDTDVYVAGCQVAYIEQVPEALGRDSILAKRQNRKSPSARRRSPKRADRPSESAGTGPT
jgi:hypothetical protein